MAAQASRPSRFVRWGGPMLVGGAAAALSLTFAGGVNFGHLPAVAGCGLLAGALAALLAEVASGGRQPGGGWLPPGGVAAALAAVVVTAGGMLVLAGESRFGPEAVPRGALITGAVVGAAWALVWRLFAVGRDWRACLGVGVLFAATAYLTSPLLSPVYAPASALARAESCRSNLKQLALGLGMYAEDYDGHLPPPVSSLGLAGIHYERFAEARKHPASFGKAVLGNGPIWAYVKNNGIWFCPADNTWRDFLGRPRTDFLPDPGLSFHWNVGVAGKRLGEIKDPHDTPLIFDRRPLHRGRRNVAFVDGSARAVPESQWRSWGIRER